MIPATLRHLGVVFVLVLLVSSAAAADPGAVSGEVTINATDGPEVVLSGSTNVDLEDVAPDPNTIVLNTSDGNATFTSSNPTSVTVAPGDIEGTTTSVTNIDATGADLTIDPSDKAAVTVGGQVTSVSWRGGLSLNDDTVAATYSSSGSGTITFRGLAANEPFTAATPSGAVIDSGTTDGSGTATVSVSSASNEDIILFTNHAPQTDDSSASPADGTNLSNPDVTFSINVSDPEFGTQQGDEVTATLYIDGSSVGSDTLTSNGTASVQHTVSEGGEHTYHWELSDSYGATNQSQTFTIYAPSVLSVYQETNPTQLVDNVTLRIRFFPLGDEDNVITREVDDGVVDLAGLPADERFVVTVRANDTEQYTYRRIVVDSIYETESIYLLNKSKPNSRVVFELQSPSGEFPPEDTILYVEKPITINNSTSYRVIAGDTFGATARFPVVLQNDERYRLRVETRNGTNERILGAYTVYGETLETLQIKRIEPRDDTDAGSVVYGSLTTYNGSDALAVRFIDRGSQTESVTYRIKEGQTVIVNNTTSTADSFAHIYQVNASNGSSYTVEYWVERPSGTTSDSFTLGQVPGIGARLPIDAQVMSIISWLMILSTMGLLVIVDTRLAPLGGVGMATGLVIIGTVAIPMAILSVAGAVAVLTLFGGGR